MSDSGPTTVGSIVGKLKIDNTEWERKVAGAKADAAELGRLRPTITVDTDAAGAVAGLAAVAAAADRTTAAGGRLTASQSALTSAQNRVTQANLAAQIAWLRLDEVQSNASSTQRQLLAATLAAERAEEQQANAATRLAAAQKAAAEETENLAVKQGLLATAQARLNDSTLKANESNRTSATRIGMIATAVALLLPLLPALGSFAVAGAGALGLMAVSGVLAIFGIKKAMEDGTVAGQKYSSGLSSLKGNFNELANTSALAMLHAFQDVVRTTNSEMPLLNRNADQFSRILGTTGAALFEGAVNALRVMEPLLIRAGVWVQQLAQGFNSWTTNGGLQKFTSFALGQMPQVITMLGALGNTIMHILQALAPLGTIGLGVLTILSQVIAAFPVWVISDLVGAATWATIAFKAWGFIAPMVRGIAVALDAMGVASTVASGPIGWIIAGVAALAAILAITIVQQQSAADAVRDYTAAVTADTGAIGENVRAAAVKSLTDAGALAAAKRLGISVKEVTDATLGNASAQTALDAQLTKLQNTIWGTATKSQDLTNAQQKQASDVRAVRTAFEGQNDAIQQAIDAYNLYQDAMGATTITTDAQKAALQANAQAAGVSVSAYLSATSAQSDTQMQTEKTTAAMYLQNDAAGLLKQTLDLLNGKTISYEQAQNQFDSGLTHLTDTTIQVTDANGQLVDSIDAGKASLDSSTASGTEARGELLNLVTAAQTSAQAFRDQGGSVDETKTKMEGMKQQIIDNAVANGWNRDAVQAYIDKLFQIPAEIPPTQIEVDTANAQARLESFIATMSGRVIDIQVNATNPAIGFGLGDGHADGGTIRGPGSASSDTAGLYPLSDGEEVISNRNGQADRFRGVLKQINAGSFDPSSFGSLRARGTASGMAQTSASTSSVSTSNTNITINEVTNPAGTAAAIARRQNMLVV